MKILTIKRFFYLCILVAATGVGIIVSAQNPDVRGMGGGAGITVFVDPNFRGKTATYTYDISNLAQTGFNDRISSVRVAVGERWEICEHANYAGNCVIVFGQERNLRQNNWDNKISSLRRVTGDRPDRPDRPGYSSIVLFTQQNYRGNREDYTRTTPNLLLFNNRAESVTVENGEWQLCTGINFTGQCTTVTQSISNLNTIGMWRRVSSVRPMSGGDGGGEYPSPRGGITLFAMDDYQGAQSRYTTSRANISKPTGSIRLGAGETWVVCDRANFTGRCQTVQSNVRDIRNFNIGRIIRSVRRQ